jgi:protein AroM
MKTVGLVTLGQSPRPDLVEQLRLSNAISTHVVGALDGIDPLGLKELLWHEQSEALPLVTRYNGESVLVANHALVPFLQKAVSALEEHVSSISILCTESFPQIRSCKPYIRVDRLLDEAIRKLSMPATGGNIAVFVPTAGQIVSAEARWSLAGYARACCLPPSAPEEVIQAACQQMHEKLPTVDCVVLDCMAYGQQEAHITGEVFAGSVIWPAQLLGSYLNHTKGEPE